MSKTKKRQVLAEECVFSAQEFEASGIRELSFEELLEVNGGRQVKDDPRTDRNSDVCRSSGRSSRGNSSGSSSRGSSSSGGSSSRGGSSGSYGSSSSSKGASGGRSSSPSKGSSSSGSSGRGSSAHDSSSRRNTGSSKGSVSSGSASGSSSKSSQSSSFGETKPSNPSKTDRKKENSPTVGGGSSGNTSFGRNTGSSGGGGSFDRSSPSRDRDSSDRDSSRSDRYSSGSSVSSGSTVYTPPVQSQPVPAPAAEKTTAPVQSQVQSEQNKNTSVSAPQNSAEPNRGEEKASIVGSVVPRVETAASARTGIAATGSSSSAVSVPPAQSQPAPASAAEKETAPVQSQVQSEQNKEASVSSLQNSAEPNKGEESSPTQDGVAPQGEAAATVQNQGKTASWRTGRNVEDTGIPLPTPFRHKRIDKIAERDKAALLRQEQIADSKSRRSGNVVGVYDGKIVTEKDVQKPAYFTQKLFSGEQSFSERFANNACAATSLLNEISTEYTSLTNRVLTEKDAVRMMQAGVASGYIDEKAAWVKNWGAAANAMWAVVETRGTWSYNKKGAHTILALDRGINEITNEKKFHFINNTLGNTAFDVWDMSVITDVSTLELMPYDPGYNPNGETRVLRFKL